MGILKYSSNNSGGSWWLSDADWQALEGAGWVVHWIHDFDDPSHKHEGENHLFGEHRHSEWETEHRLTAVKWSGNRWLGAAAMSAVKITDDPEAGVREFENLTNQSASDLGCNCCGQPHNFSYEDDAGNNRYMDISVKTSWSF